MIWEAKFIGRENELTIMQHALNQVKKGQGSILFITGEAGVGKTRLVDEFSKTSDQENFEFLSGNCMYHEGVDPYLPFIDMFRGYLRDHPYLATAVMASFNSPAALIFDFDPEKKGRYSPAPDAEKEKQRANDQKNKDNTTHDGTYENSTNGAGEMGITDKSVSLQDAQLLEGKHRMFETVSKIIINISKKQPLAMFIDDIQWADEASLHLLHYLARNIQDQPILIIGAYRTDELDFTQGCKHPLQELIHRLGAESLYNTFNLQRLNHIHSTQIVSDLLGVKNIPEGFSELIYNETEGNPFFIKEVLRTLIEEGALSIKNDKLELNITPEEIVIPTSIKELINLQLQRLDSDCREVLEYASVIGDTFNLSQLQNLIDKSEAQLINILGKLIESKSITNAGDNGGFIWKFTHNKTREVIYGELNDDRKRLIHLSLAKYIEKAEMEEDANVVFELAYHFYYGYDFDRALSYSIEGGEKALKSYANKEALELYNIGLNSLRRLDEKLANTIHYKEKKIEVLSQLGTLHKTLGQWDKALEYYEQIIPICDEIKDPHKKSKAYLNLGWLYQRRSYWEEAQKNFRKSLTIADSIKDHRCSAEAYHGLGAVFEREGVLEKAIECYTISRKFAENNQDYLNLAKAHNAFGRIYNQQANYMKAIDHKEKSIHIFEKLNNLPELAKAYTSMGLTYFDMGDMNKNIEFNEKCIELADEISDIRIKGYGLSNAVEALISTKQLDKALDYASDSLEIFKKLGERFMIALNYMNYGIIFKYRKEWSKSKYYFKTTIEFMENLKIPYHLADCYRQYAGMYKMKGEPKKAKYYLQKARDIYQSISADKYVKQIDNELTNGKFK